MAKDAKKQEGHQQGGNGLKRLEERLQKVSQAKGFPAYIRTNFERLSHILDSSPPGSMKWEELARWAVDEGLTGGKPLKPATAKRAYEREVERRKKRKGEGGSKPKVQASTIFEPVRVPESTKAIAPTSDDAEARIEKLKRQMAKRSGRET